MEKKASQEMVYGRLLLFPLPFQGHINPMLQLANILHSKGFKITIIHTNFNSPNQSNYPHFTFVPISKSHDDANALSADFDNVLENIKFINKNFGDLLHDCMVRLLSEATKEEEPIRCFITDAILHFTQAVADQLKVPRMVLRTSSLASFHVFHSFPLLSSKGYFSLNNDYKLDAPVAELPLLKVKDINKVFPHAVYYELLELVMKATKQATGLIWNTFEELEQTSFATIKQDFPIPNFTIGPFHKYFLASSSSLLKQDQTAISWLDLQKPKSVLYVSFGSIAVMDKNGFLEMAWALANSMQKFLWVVRPGIIRGCAEWLEPLPDDLVEMVRQRGHIVKWAPQQEVLAHPATAGFWTHNGWNSTLESICEGIPMICSPWFGDQLTNARCVDGVWKVGVELENGLERREIESAIKRVMGDEEGKEMRMRIECLKEKVNLCLKEGGSSYQSLKNLVDYIMSL